MNDIKPGSQWLYYEPEIGPKVMIVDSVTSDGVVRFTDSRTVPVANMREPFYSPVPLSEETIASFATDRPAIPSVKRQEMSSERAKDAALLSENDIRIRDLEPMVELIRRRGRLLFTIGIARSGKSTWCTRWSQYLEEGPTGQVRRMDVPIFPRSIVCGDDIRLALHGERFNKDAEAAVWMIHTYTAKSLLSRGHDAVIDGTHTTEDSLLRVLNIDTDATCKVFDTDPDACKDRARQSGHHDLVDRGVIDRQHRQLCELRGQEGGIEGVVERVRQRVKDRWQL
jgi:predicted kinase